MKRLLPVLGLCGLCGCGDQLYVAHDTVVGVNANVSANRQQGQLVIGFDRDFAALVPVMEPAEGATDKSREAMAVFGCTSMTTSSIFLTGYSDVISTGEAAAKLAKALGTKGKKEGAEKLLACADDKKKDNGNGNGNGNGNPPGGGNDNG